jgi:pentatricopeptide repeat protein
MHSNHQSALTRLALVLALPFGGALAACTDAESATLAATADEVPVQTGDAELADHQRALLELAFDAASALPHEPHIKNRSRAQEGVVIAYLQLDQPQLALEALRGIDNWRRGACYADLAFYLAERGGSEDRIVEALDHARQVAGNAEEWRRDRILAKVARVHALLGQDQLVADTTRQISSVEASRVAGAYALGADEARCDAQLGMLDRLPLTATFEEVREAIFACLALHERFFADVERRDRIEAKIVETLPKVPLDLRIGMLQTLAEANAEQGSTERALELLAQAEELYSDAKWTAEHSVPILARSASIRYAAGQHEAGLAEATVALETYESAGRRLIDIYRGKALRPLAEAYVRMGQPEDALRVYRMVIEAGVINPNSRPRAMDLAATCSSMAVNGVEPDAALNARIAEIRAGLGDPW